jgi:Fur family ferric uptake transcriptional regulator
MEGRLLTPQRRLLLRQIQKSGGHISAKELYRRASSKNKSISLATVYRTLRLFKDLDLIEERRLGKIFLYYELKEAGEHQHMVCRCCGNVIEFDSNLVRKIVKKVQEDYGFKVAKTELYIEGYCKKCQDEGVEVDGEEPALSIQQLETQENKKYSDKKKV